MSKAPITQKPSGWTVKEITDALDAVGLNQAAIARELKVTPTAVSLAVQGKSCSSRIYKAIAEAIKEDVKRIWPQFYLYGTPKRGRRMCVWNRQAA